MHIKSIETGNRYAWRVLPSKGGQDGSQYPSTLLLSRKVALEERIHGVPELRGWTVGEVVIPSEPEMTSVYRIYDKERREHWLFYGPWKIWQRVSDLWAHLDSINRIMANVSPLFQAFGPMLPKVRWLKSSEGFFGIAERRSDLPFLQYLKNEKNPFHFQNIVQMTGFLRFLQTGKNVYANSDSHKIIDDLEKRTVKLIEEVEERIPRTPRFSRWISFAIQNARSVAYAGSLSLSLGEYATSCFAYTRRTVLLIDYPFLLCEDMTHMDICRILFEIRTRDHQDLKCLIDVYFDREVPSYFFAQLAHYQVTTILKKLASSVPGSSHERKVLKEFEQISLDYDGFRTPVPCWYK